MDGLKELDDLKKDLKTEEGRVFVEAFAPKAKVRGTLADYDKYKKMVAPDEEALKRG